MDDFDSWPHVRDLPDEVRQCLKSLFKEELTELKPYVEREIHDSPAAKKQKQLDSDSSAITRLYNVVQECLVVLYMAALFTGFWDELEWNYFEQQLGSNCPVFRNRLAYALTRFKLRIHDKYYFRQSVNAASYNEECAEVFHRLETMRLMLQEDINLRSHESLNLQVKEMGIRLTQSIARRDLDLKNYKFVSEMDILCMLKLSTLSFSCGQDRCDWPDIPLPTVVYIYAAKTSKVEDMLMVKNALRDCIPLEMKTKCHLNKTMLSGMQSNVKNFLICELLRDTRILELKESVPTPDSREVLGSILGDVVSCLSNVVWRRCDQLERNAYHINLLFETGWPGSFAEEVIEVVKYADYIRMYRGHNFIEVCHILLALDGTRMAEAVKGAISDAELNFLIEYKAEYPIYDFYVKANDIASCMGNGMVGVKHLVLAILWGGGKLIAGKQGKDMLEDFDPSSWSEFFEKVYIKNFLEATKGCSAEILPTDLEDGYCGGQDVDGAFSLYRQMFHDIRNDRFIELKFQ